MVKVGECGGEENCWSYLGKLFQLMLLNHYPTGEKEKTKKDDMLDYKMERVPFLEEQVRKIQEGGKLLTMDIERLMLSEDNRFDFVNEIAAEANEYVESNRDEYGGSKKAILHVLSNRVNDSGFYRPEAYAESDPFKPGPSYLKEEFT
nr:protein PLASTID TRANSCRIPTIONALLY ACTIVE 7 isoform X2 [Ziziphus jujuba var. spinosa]